MPITTSDIKVRLSTTSGSEGNSQAQANPNASLGKYISTTDLSGTALNNLFDNISGDEQALGTTDYRCVFVYNSHSTLTLQTPKYWLSGVRSTAVGSTDVITASGHGWADADVVRVEAELVTDALPSGLSNSTSYYLRDTTTHTFKLASTAGGSAINIGDSSGFATRQYGYTTISIGLDPTGIAVATGSSAQATFVSSETGVPAGVSFSSPTTKSGGLAGSGLSPGYCQAIWVKRIPLNTGARNADGMALGWAGDTSA